MIALYFNDSTVKNCGICDNCINQNELVVSSDEFKTITEKIFEAISKHPLKPTEIIIMTGIKKEKFWKVLQILHCLAQLSAIIL